MIDFESFLIKNKQFWLFSKKKNYNDKILLYKMCVRVTSVIKIYERKGNF